MVPVVDGEWTLVAPRALGVDVGSTPCRSFAAGIVREVEAGRFRLAPYDWVVDGRAWHAHPCDDGGGKGVPVDAAFRILRLHRCTLFHGEHLVHLVRVPLGLRQDSERRQRQQHRRSGEVRRAGGEALGRDRGAQAGKCRRARRLHDLYRFFGHGHYRFKTQESYMLRQPRKRGKAWATTSTPTSSGARPPTT